VDLWQWTNGSDFYKENLKGKWVELMEAISKAKQGACPGSGVTFFIEYSFREAKSECGIADHQVRRWDTWYYPYGTRHTH
jgi:hypothetical protein